MANEFPKIASKIQIVVSNQSLARERQRLITWKIFNIPAILGLLDLFLRIFFKDLQYRGLT